MIEIDGTEKYSDIIERYSKMPIEELIKEQKELKQSISYRHQLLSSEVLTFRLKKSLEKLKKSTYNPKEIKI
jgi:hypothetical protein|tara:strand:- start:2881 stop:3096 length:216 start_codon:yes stop_codon:yes gene_type:complete